jgi:hypothetical protein
MKQIIEVTPGTTISGLPAPRGWHIARPWGDGLAWERLIGERITVIEDISFKADGKRWLHVSVAKSKKHLIPTYDDLQVVRKAFVGEHRECYQVFPTKDRYVNIGNVLHLWACLDSPEGVLPHFEGFVDGRMTI